MTNAMDQMKQMMNMNSVLYTRMLNSWMIGMGSMSWTQDQSSFYVKSVMDRMQLATSENVKALEGAFLQMKESQLQLYNIIMESIGAATTDAEMPSLDYLTSWNKLINDMAAKAVSSFSDLSSTAAQTASDLSAGVTKI